MSKDTEKIRVILNEEDTLCKRLRVDLRHKFGTKRTFLVGIKPDVRYMSKYCRQGCGHGMLLPVPEIRSWQLSLPLQDPENVVSEAASHNSSPL